MPTRLFNHGTLSRIKWAGIAVLSLVSNACASPDIPSAPDSAPLARQVPANSATTLSDDDARHLLSRTGIGAAPLDLLRFRELNRQQAIDTILAEFKQTVTVPFPDWVNQPVPHYYAQVDWSINESTLFDNERDVELSQLRQWWTLEMLETTSPQTERLVLFWHDVFATSYYDTNRQSLAMARQNQTFRSLGMGSWRTLLKKMIRDPALLEFLDAGSNHKNSPNENLARELLELFTLGEGNYNEQTVKEAARALTGHDTVRNHDLAFRLKTWQQDRANKELFGVSGAHDGDDLIDLILRQPQAAVFMAEKFWHAYVSDAKPDPQWISTVSEQFRNSDYQIQTLYRSMLESDAFWSEKNRGSMIKSPIDLIMGTARSLEYPKHGWQSFPGALRTLEMELFAPPNVSGWSEGAAFITPGRLLNRFELVDRLVENESALTASKDMAGQMQNTMQMSNGGNVAMMADSNGASMATPPVQIRVTAENYQGPVEYQVSFLKNNALLWQSPKTIFQNGHDTELYGMLGDRSKFVWVNEAVPVPEQLIDEATHVKVAFLNDAAGPGGDRNFYIDGLQIRQHWISGSQGKQQSSCVPNLPANAWRLYCQGSLTFDLQVLNSALSERVAPMWSASGIHVEWGNDNRTEDAQTLLLTLDHFQTPAGRYHNFQIDIATFAQEAPQISLHRFGCWPSCVSDWPECAWSDRHFNEQKTLVFPRLSKSDPLWESDQPLACHLLSRSDAEKQIVSVLWQNLEYLLQQVAGTQRAQQFTPVLRKVSEKLANVRLPIEQTPYTAAKANIQISANYRPVVAARSNLPAPVPALNSSDQLQAALATEALPVSRLLIPELEEVSFSSATVSEIVRHPVFQLK